MAIERMLSTAEPRNQKVKQLEGLEWRFTDKQYTAWGGLRLLEEMLRRVGLTEVLCQSGLPEPGSNRGYEPVEVMQGFLVSVWVGATRFAHTALLRFDRVLQEMFSLQGVPSTSTFTRFFRRFGRKEVEEVFGSLSRWFWEQLQPVTMTLDLDSIILTRYGWQEGSVLGYNPHRRGRPSQHPLLAFAAELRMVVHAWMRPGNANSGDNAEGFFREVLALLKPRHRIGLVRGDSGFSIDKLLKLWEAEAINYIVATRITRQVRRLLTGITNWVEIAPGLSVSELEYTAWGWKKARRLVVARQQISDTKARRCRWLMEIPGYTYSVYVSNLSLPPVEIHRLYAGRADSENRIKELGQDFGVRGFVSQKFWATEAAFRAVIFAYNLMALFRQAVLKATHYQMLATLRVHCFAIGASLGRKGHKRILRLGLSPPRRGWFEGLFASSKQIVVPVDAKTYNT